MQHRDTDEYPEGYEGGANIGGIPKIVSVEGLIGAGKSTLLAYLKQRGCVVVPEPVGVWTNHSGYNPLDLFYKAPERWAFTFQMLTLQSRIAALRQTMRDNPHAEVIFIERSTLCDKEVFAKLAYEQGNMNAMEWNLYRDMHGIVQNSIPELAGSIHLTLSVDECLARIRRRNRIEEDCVTPEYLERLRGYQDDWLHFKRNRLELSTASLECALDPTTACPILDRTIIGFLDTLGDCDSAEAEVGYDWRGF
jgi:deoxyadenosine/deoxycytidine kinase